MSNRVCKNINRSSSGNKVRVFYSIQARVGIVRRRIRGIVIIQAYGRDWHTTERTSASSSCQCFN